MPIDMTTCPQPGKLTLKAMEQCLERYRSVLKRMSTSLMRDAVTAAGKGYPTYGHVSSPARTARLTFDSAGGVSGHGLRYARAAQSTWSSATTALRPMSALTTATLSAASGRHCRRLGNRLSRRPCLVALRGSVTNAHSTAPFLPPPSNGEHQ